MIGTITSTAQTYQFVESVEYDPIQNRWLASNGNSIIERASDGTLSYFGNATASHGMEVVDNVLYAISGASIKAYDLDDASELMSLNIPGVGFLNGMTNSGAAIYVTDFSNRAIFRIDITDLANPTWEQIVSNTGSTPNGIVYDEANNRLIYVNWGNNAAIKAVDLTDNSISTILANTGLGNIDGIDEDGEGNYYISSWSPNRITKYSADFQNVEIISTPFINSPADIGYSIPTDTLAIPVGNNVVFVGFETMTSTEELKESLEIGIYPNPTTDYLTVSFHLEKATKTKLEIVGMDGRLYQRPVQEELVAGTHRIILTDLDFPAGQYACRLTTEVGEQTVLFVKE